MMMGSGGWVGGLAAMVLFWGLFLAGVVWLVRATVDGLGRGATGGDDRVSARAILDERFASGELPAAEYRERRDAIETGR